MTQAQAEARELRRIATDERMVPVDTPWETVAAFAGEYAADSVAART